MAYLGIDQSLNGTGLCLISDDGKVLRLETVDPGGLRGVERLAFVKARAQALLGLDVRFVANEGYSYDSVGRVFELGEMGGVLKLLVHEHGIGLTTVAPSALKKFATGKPSADKAAMLKAAREAGVQPDDDNQADAFFLAEVARQFHLGDSIPTSRARLEVVHTLHQPKTKKPVRKLRRLVTNAM